MPKLVPKRLPDTPINTESWQADLGAIDVLSHIPDLNGTRLGYTALAERATTYDVAGKQVLVASLDDWEKEYWMSVVHSAEQRRLLG